MFPNYFAVQKFARKFENLETEGGLFRTSPVYDFRMCMVDRTQ